MRLRPETRLRARTVQLLYMWEMQGRPPLRHTVTPLLARQAQCRRGIESAEALAANIVEAADTLDAEIGVAVDHWRFDRIGAIERSILRLALYELGQPNVPPKVVISESVRLARWFGGESAPAFVNGVLDAVARRAGRL